MMNLLSIDWNFDPTLFSIFGFEVRWYSLTWIAAILIASKYYEIFFRREGFAKNEELSESIFVYGALALILGARIGHCLFYEPIHYLSHPLEIITGIRDGGLASHGAALGVLIGFWLFSRRNNIPLIWSLDRVMVPTGIGGALIRLGNLCNSEIFGTETTLPWGFRFLRSREWNMEYAPAACHPTQIYEAICYLIVYAIVSIMYFRYDIGRRRPGVMLGVGLVGIFLSRIFIESIKNTQVGFEAAMTFNMGQWLSVPFVVGGLYMIYRGYSRPAIEVKTK